MGIYKECDIRGEYGQDLLDLHASRLGQAIIHLKGPVEVIVAGDGRLSTGRLKSHLIASLMDGGCRVFDLGQVPTPVFYFARQYLGVETAVMVTASHNPAEDNGFKIIIGALPISPQELHAIKSFMESQAEIQSTAGGSVEKTDILPAYLTTMQALVPPLQGLKVVVDCANGMASLIANTLWESSGAQAIFLFDQVDGHFPNHPPNPARPENLMTLGSMVRRIKADFGVAYDGDGDRVAFVDANGTPIPNDYVIVLFVRQAQKETPAVIVYDQKCSVIVRETILAAGGEPVMERSGHTFIKTSFFRFNAPYAGEISGHHFFQNIRGDDGVMASLFFGKILSECRKSLEELVAELPAYPITPDLRIPMEITTIQRVLDDLMTNLAGEARLKTLDGVRLEYDDGWGLARPSVTEPVITLRFEGKTAEALNRIRRRFEEVAPDLAGRLNL